jgi:hypothetical protein
MDNISLVETDEIDKKIQLVMRQTNYNNEEALDKLKIFQFDELKVIKEYFGITEKKSSKINSVNQEIYKQIRSHLDGAMTNYRERVEKGEVKKIV